MTKFFTTAFAIAAVVVAGATAKAQVINIIGDSTTSATTLGPNANLGNGDYQSIASGTGGIPYTDIPNWHNASGDETVNHGQTNGTAPMMNPQEGAVATNYVAFQFNNRVNINDTAYSPSAGDVFSFSTFWVPNGNAIAPTNTLTVSLYTSAVPVNGDVTVADLTELASVVLETGDVTGFYTASEFYTATGAEGNVYLALQATDAGPGVFSRTDLVSLWVVPGMTGTLKGDVNLDQTVTFLDINAFIGVLASNGTQAEADCNCDGAVDFLDIQAFIDILAGS